MKTPIEQRYKNNPELAEKLKEIKEDISDRMENDPEFDFMEVEDIFFEHGLEPDYIFEVLNELC